MNDNDLSRRDFLAAAGGTAAMALAPTATLAATDSAKPLNLAIVATPSASYVSADTRLTSLNSGAMPGSSADPAQLAFGTAPEKGTQWAQYEWNEPVSTNAIDVYWWGKHWGIALPVAHRLLYWDGEQFVPVKNARGFGLAPNTFNRTEFDTVTTRRLRLEIDPAADKSVGVLQWRVWSVGDVPKFAPVVTAGVDRTVMLGAPTYLLGRAAWLDRKRDDAALWRKVSGPGTVTFTDAGAAQTAAHVSALGDYTFELSAHGDGFTTRSTLRLRAETPPPRERLDVVYTTPYAITSPLWNARAKALIVNWIPHCMRYCERTDLTIGEGGIDNFIEPAKALRGEPHGRHKGYVFSNAWVHQTIESMCIALMVDPQGDAEIITAQAANARDAREVDSEHPRGAGARWLPADGVHARGSCERGRRTLEPARNRARSRRLRRRATSSSRRSITTRSPAARTCGSTTPRRNSPTAGWRTSARAKKEWFDGHQEMEQALVRFGRFVNDMEGSGQAATRTSRWRGSCSNRAQRRHRIRPEPPAAATAVRSRRPRGARGVLLLRHGGHRGGDARP